MARSSIVQSTFDFAIREINALEQRIVKSEDDADAMLWEQARQVVAQLNAGLSQRQLAAQWINVRRGQPYTLRHVQVVRQVVTDYLDSQPRPRFRDVYNEVTHAPAKSSNVHFSSETSEHCTPPELLAVVVECLGTIDLDPCSNPGVPNVPALHHLTIADDGLQQRWSGTVYMNPPYGEVIDQWIEKLCNEHEGGEVSEAIALVPGRIDTQWFRRLRDYVCCFVEGRLTFLGNDDPAPFPSVVVYLGEDIAKFYRHFSGLGDIWQRLEPEMFGA